MGEEEPIDNDENDFIDTNIKSSEESDEDCEDEGKFQCGTSSNFICNPKKCDGHKDCPLGEDEEDCPSGSKKASKEESDDQCRGDDKFRCGKTSVFICEVQKCDGNKNCPGGEDEENCPSGSDEGSGEDNPEEGGIEIPDEPTTTKPTPIIPDGIL